MIARYCKTRECQDPGEERFYWTRQASAWTTNTHRMLFGGGRRHAKICVTSRRYTWMFATYTQYCRESIYGCESVASSGHMQHREVDGWLGCRCHDGGVESLSLEGFFVSFRDCTSTQDCTPATKTQTNFVAALLLIAAITFLFLREKK